MEINRVRPSWALLTNVSSIRRGISTSILSGILNRSASLGNSDEIDMLMAVDEFSDKKLYPVSGKLDESKEWPASLLKQANELGLGGVNVSKKGDGLNLSRRLSSHIFESLSRGDVSTSSIISIHNMCNTMIFKWGTDDQIKKYCSPLSTHLGDYTASYCLTEPNNGSDSGNIQTKAVQLDNGDFVLNGTKCFISGAGMNQLYLVMARTGPKDSGNKGISCFIVEKDTPGLSFGKIERKMGWNCSITRSVIFEDVVVGKSQLLGALNLGFKIAMSGLDGGRINIASSSLGGAHRALESTIDYVSQRKQFGSSIKDFQNTQFKMAEMASMYLSSRLLVHQAAHYLDESHPQSREFSAMAKLQATENASLIVDRCLQMHGGYGYLSEYHIEQISRDLRVNQILEGTNEMMRTIIGRHVFS